MGRARGLRLLLTSTIVASLLGCGDDATSPGGAAGGGPSGAGGGSGRGGSGVAGAGTAPQGPLAKPGTAGPELAPSPLRKGPGTFYDSVKFLFEGSSAPQRTVEKGTFAVEKVAVVRGRVLDETGAALPGVTIAVVGQPRWGSVTTRADGSYDLAVSGGGPLALRFTLPGAFPVQRTSRVPWNRIETMRDVVLLAPSATSTAVTFGNTAWQVAAGDRIVDKSGARRAWIAIPPGTTAKAIDAKKAERPLAKGTLRLTEFTRGDRGKEAMPGDLPPQSAYTFAAAFAFDEAEGDRVVFDKPVYAYVEDFLGFPAGTTVPSGTFEGDQDVWEAELSGRVFAVLGSGASLSLDGTGDGKADDPKTFGLAEGELVTIATFAPPNGRLWRVPLAHFSMVDFNWGTAPPLDATAPPAGANAGGASTDDPTNCDTAVSANSTISCENRVLGEDLPIVGTGLSLHYQSDRVEGRVSAFRLTVPVTGSTVTKGAKPPTVSIDVLGQHAKDIPVFGLAPNQTYSWTWDGKDGYGRTWPTPALARVTVNQPYDAVYSETKQFNSPPGTTIESAGARDVYTFSRTYDVPLGVYRAKEQGFGGWTLSFHHAYDAASRTLYWGSGGQVNAAGIGQVTKRVYGQAESDPSAFGWQDGLIGRAASLQNVAALTRGADGYIYFVEEYALTGSGGPHTRLRRIDADGSVHTLAGTLAGSSADGVPAVTASLGEPGGIAFFRGEICIGDFDRIRCITAGGLMHTLRENPKGHRFRALTVGPDKALYAGYTGGIDRIGIDGAVTRLAGGGTSEGEDIPALSALVEPNALAVLVDGTLAFADSFRYVVRGIGVDGRVRTLAGSGSEGILGEGGPARQAQLCGPESLAARAEGGFFVGDFGEACPTFGRLLQVDGTGRLSTLAGGATTYDVLEGPSRAVAIAGPTGIVQEGDGSLLYTNLDSLHRLTFAYPGAGSGEVAVTEPAGSAVFVFDGGGRHVRTISALTKTTLLSFDFDPQGLLQSATDDVGRKVIIERDGSGNALAIVAPYGQRTTLQRDGAGWLASVTDPIGRKDVLTHDAKGLLVHRTDARGGEHAMTYDAEGKLLSDAGTAGKSWTLASNPSSKTTETTLTSALGRVSRTAVQQNGGGNEIRTQTLPDGTSAVTTQTPSSTTTTLPDGTVVTASIDPDPRWGMNAPYSKTETVKLPRGTTITQIATREAELADPGDPHSLLTLSASMTVGDAPPRKSTYEAASRTLTIRSAEGRIFRQKIDDHGRTIRLEPPGVLPVDFTYDASGRPLAAVQGARSVTYAYGASGYLDTVKDGLGRIGSFQRDAAGRPSVVTLPGARLVTALFDANDNVTSVTPAGRDPHLFAFELDDQLQKATAPGGAPTTFAYDADRALTTAVREDGATVSIAYDAAGRWKKTAYPEGDVTPTYHQATGQIASVTGPGDDEISFVYDGSRPLSVTAKGAVKGTLGWTYDARGRVSRQSLDANPSHDLDVQFDDDDLVTQVGPITLERSEETGFVTAVEAAGTREIVERSLKENGAIVSYGEPTHWRVTYKNKALYDLTVERDVGGRIVARTELLDGVGRVFRYGYDAAGRLATVEQDGVQKATFTYDPSGNRLTEDGKAALGTYDTRDRVQSYGEATFVHDARGDRTSRTRGGVLTTYEHDTRGALRKVKSGGKEITYATDPAGRRVARTEDGAVTHRWLYRDGLRPEAEQDAAGVLRWRFIYGTERHVPDVAVDATGERYRLITDQLGSLRLVVRGSDGIVVQRVRHDALGRLEEDFVAPGFSALSFGFAGGLLDRGTGLVHFGAREYDPTVARWVERDPLGLSGGLNEYDYVGAMPIDHVDRSGLLSDFDLTYGVQGASRGALKGAFAEAAPGVAAVGAAIGATVFAPPLLKAVGGLAGMARVGYVALGTAATEVTLAEVGAGTAVGVGCGKTRLGKLPMPARPAGMSPGEFGKLMGWGTGHEAARTRIDELSRSTLSEAGLTPEIAKAWEQFYRNEAARNPTNPSALGRADLMEAAAKLLE